MPRTLYLRVLYCLALLTIVPGTLAGASGWTGLVTGGGLLLFTGRAGFVVILVLVLARIVYVIRVPGALDVHVTPLAKIRAISVAAMYIGVACALGLFFVVPLTLFIFGQAGDAGIAFFVMGVILYLGSNLGWLGALSFDISRMAAKGLSDLPEPVQRSKRLAKKIAAAVAATGAVIIWLGLWTAHREFIELCSTAPKPRVFERADRSFQSVLIEQLRLPHPPMNQYGIHANEIALLDQLSFLEVCSGSYCSKIVNARTGNSGNNPQGQIETPTSAIVLAPAVPVVRSSLMGSTTYQLDYHIRHRPTGKILASATEFVFDWGRFAWLRGLAGSVARFEACGYAQARPHKFGSNVYRDEVFEAYDNAHKALIVSVMPAAGRPAAGK